MRFTSSATPLALLLAASGTAAAQNRAPVETTVGFELVTSSIEPLAADSAGIGSRAWGFQIPASAVALRVLSLNGDVGVLFMSDEAAFSQDTNLGERTSGVTGGPGRASQAGGRV